MTGQPKITLPLLAVLDVLTGTTGETFGLEIVERTGLGSGTIHPMLRRLESIGWAESAYEDAEVAQRAGRRTRRYYRLTGEGRKRAEAALAERRKSLGMTA